MEDRKRYIGLMLFLLVGVMALSACKGAKSIQGTWYATNSDGLEMKIKLTEDQITFTTKGEKDMQNTYKQIGTGFQNNASYKSIEFDGTTYSFVFPNKKDEDNALILVPYDKDEALKGTIYWVLSKKDYPDYDKYK